MLEVRTLSGAEGREHLEALAEVLTDCVEGGASVSFMAPFSKSAAVRFFESVLEEVEAGNRILLAAFMDGRLVGTVQILTSTPSNQPHRADVAKLLVSRAARLHGIGTRLMQHVEEAARLAGKTLLVLDTASGGSAERMYTRLGWTRVGVIPRYALFPDGTWCDTTLFWKEIALGAQS
jgi:GNAT superfamily N-acetyltransferase